MIMNEDNDEKIREAFYLVKEENICIRKRVEWLEDDLRNLYEEIMQLRENKMKTTKPIPVDKKGNTVRVKKKKSINT